MPIEVEAKAYATDLKAIEKDLIEKGAKFVLKGHQKDTYFNHPNRDFAETDEALRIREVAGKTFFTYKGPKIDLITKTREEIEIQVDDPESAREFLLRLGFKEVMVVNKMRTKYNMDDFMVCLDDVEGLGEFVEIEATTDDEDQIDDLKESIIKTLKSWNLNKTERKSYLELLFEQDR